MTSGSHYLLRVGGFSTSSGPGSVNLSFVGPPANDLCDDAIPTPCNTTTTFSNAAATTSVDDPAYSCRIGGPAQGFGTVWFKFLAPGSTATITTEGSLVSERFNYLQDLRSAENPLEARPQPLSALVASEATFAALPFDLSTQVFSSRIPIALAVRYDDLTPRRGADRNSFSLDVYAELAIEQVYFVAQDRMPVRV